MILWNVDSVWFCKAYERIIAKLIAHDTTIACQPHKLVAKELYREEQLHVGQHNKFYVALSFPTFSHFVKTVATPSGPSCSLFTTRHERTL